jgi:hypothetical protein
MPSNLNHPPVIDYVNVSGYLSPHGVVTELSAGAHDPDNDPLSYQWDGIFAIKQPLSQQWLFQLCTFSAPTSPNTNVTCPVDQVRVASIELTVTDGNGGKATRELQVKMYP